MKITIATLAIAALAAAAAFAETISTRDGRVFENARVMRVEPDGITVSHSTGLEKIHARFLSDEDRARFGLTPEGARAYHEAQREEREERARQAVEELERQRIAARTRVFDLYCIRSDSEGLKCYDENRTEYIIRGYEAMPDSSFSVLALEGDRVKLSPVSAPVELFPVEGPGGRIKVKPAGAIRKMK